ncbi:Vacuolar protein sorting-associated protein [Paramyrothecium foliicola]|nr:Vacuolar protein sorting-associated protein [Paramyrothecium foliicola]
MASPQSPRKSNDNFSLLSAGSRTEAPPFGASRVPHGHRPRSRRGSTASSIRSIAGTLDSTTSGWAAAVHESGQNAISTLLQPPIVRTGLQPYTSASISSVHKAPTARDIPPVSLTNIPQVDASEFGSYISQFGALYDQLRRIKENETDTPTQARPNEHDDQLDSSSDGYLRPGSKQGIGRKGSTASLSSLNSIDMPGPLRRSSSSFRKATQGPPPLSTIPNVYFEEDFHLENPRTFDVVSERSEVIPPTAPASGNRGDSNGNVNAPRKALATNAILQEKLSWYMDTIEIHLINSISTASTTFFTALGSLKELHSEAADSVERIKALRHELETLDEEIAANGLKIVQKRRRQENLQLLNDAVKQLRQIVQGVGNCESLVDGGELEKALAGIDSLEKLIAGERDEKNGLGKPSHQLRDLRAASALQGVNADLATLRFRIGKAYETQFMNVLVNDLRKHTETVSSQEVLMRWSNAASRARGGSHARSPSVFPAYLTGTEELKSQLLASMTGMQRAQHIATAASAYRDIVLREIRNLIRRPLPSSNDDDNESMMSVSTSGGKHLSNHEKSSILARNLRALEPEDGEELLINIYVGVTETLRRLTTQVKVLLDIASSLSDAANIEGTKSPPVRSPLSSPRPDRHNFPAPNIELQEELHKALDITTLLSQAVDVSIDKIVKILKVRSEQSTHLPLVMFLRYFTLNLYFANECEAISGRSGTSLKTVVNNHIKEFVQRNGDAATQKLAQEMESDQWTQKDFTERDSEILQKILECSTHDAVEWIETRIWVPSQELLEETNQSQSQADANGAGKDKARMAIIDEEGYALPNPAVLCLQGIGQFLHLNAAIPSMTVDVGTSLVAYLQLFNSRCTQLILGAGATKSAGLKNITTKHLALASRALAFIITLIPHIREFIRRHGGSAAGVSNLMGEFDKVRRLLQEHQNSIHQKLVQIMEGRAAAHAKALRNTNWDSDTSTGPHTYIETLAKETITLHRALTKTLPETSIQMIMHPVFASYKDQLGNALSEAVPQTKAGQDSMMRDVEFFTTKLGKIDGFGNAGEYLSGIVNSKKVKVEEPSEPANSQDDKTEGSTTEKAASSESGAEKEGDA